MSVKRQIVVVIPIHSSSPSSYELISFAQCFKILGAHDIVLIAPERLDVSAYKKVAPQLQVQYVNPKWQSDILHYNKLKLSRFFYSLFYGYEFLLTYELDAFVFRDEIENWCRMPYDYIGAPWFKGHDKPENELTGVGNSGFSLRRISAVKKLLSKMYLYGINNNNQSQNILIGNIKLLLFKLLSLRGENYSIQRFPSLFEDHFLCDVAVKRNSGFRIAPVSEAVKFAFEAKPETLYEMNHRQLPMGCHAWWRYNLEFWKPHIESCGYNLN